MEQFAELDIDTANGVMISEFFAGLDLRAELPALRGVVESRRPDVIVQESWGSARHSSRSSRYLGLLASTMERWGDAERHFRRALEVNERIGARPWLAHTQEDYARMLLARATLGDRDKALQLLADARSRYRELGMDSWAERASDIEPPAGAAAASRRSDR